MSQIKYKNQVIYTLPESQSEDIDSVFFMSVHKSGSTLLNNMVKAMTDMLGYSFIDIQSFFFNNGLSDSEIPKQTGDIFKEKGYIYSGFRYFPHQYDIDVLKKCKLIMLVRDPRDAVVSQYYSITKSHPLPGDNIDSKLHDHMVKVREEALAIDINDFCLNEISGFVKKLEAYDEVMKGHDNFRLYQYEEVIYLKKKWVLGMLNFLGWKMGPGQPKIIANRFNILPNKEDVNKHIRQVHPGNYMSKLDPAVIKEINQKYEKILLRYNYI